MIADASLAIEELMEAARRDEERRYAFYQMLNATDRVLWRLEVLNRDGVKEVSGGARDRMRAALDELPAVCLEAWCDSVRTQELLDGVFDLQDALFFWHDPDQLLDLAGEGRDG